MTNNNVNDVTDEGLYRKVIAMLHHFLYDLKRNLGLLLTCIALVVAVLYIYNYKQSGIYRSSFTVAYDELIRKVYGDRLAKLNVLVERGQHKRVADLLSVDEKVTVNIRGIEGVNIIGEQLVNDLNTDTIPFIVNLYMTDTIGVNSVQYGIVSYLESGNKHVEELKEHRKKQIAEELTYVERQLLLLDSTKRSLAENIDSKTGSRSLVSIYDLSYGLYKKKQDLQEKLATPSTLHIIDEATISLSKGSSYFKLGIFGLLIGVLLYLMIQYLLKPAISYKG